MRWSSGSRGVFVDSGAYASLALDNEQHFRDASAIALAIANARRPTVTTNFIVAETHALVLSRAGRHIAFRQLEFIEQNADLIERVTIEDELSARELLEQYDDKTFSYTDATSFAVMRRLGLKDVFTFDRHFAQFGFSPLKPS